MSRFLAAERFQFGTRWTGNQSKLRED